MSYGLRKEEDEKINDELGGKTDIWVFTGDGLRQEGDGHTYNESGSKKVYSFMGYRQSRDKTKTRNSMSLI